MTSPAAVIQRALGAYLAPGRSYPTPLPSELAPWYAYVSDAGHSIVCAIQSVIAEGAAPEDAVVPVPVRTVLREGYRMEGGYVVVDLPYDSAMGLQVPAGDEEFGGVEAGAAPVQVRIENDARRIVGTNYFDTPAALLGHVYLSVNAGAFRLLVPSASAGWLAEMQGAEYAILTRGMWTPPPQPQEDGTRRIQHPREGLELLWEDHSNSPFSIHLGATEADRLPARSDEGRTDLQLLVYAEGIELVQEIPARYRRASKLPYLKPWSGR